MTYLEEGVLYSYMNDTLRLLHVKNTGIAYSIGSDWHPYVRFLLFNILVTVLLALLLLHSIKNIHWHTYPKLFSLSFILGGGFGNLLDRYIYDGGVTDFLNIGLHGFRSAIFNIADIFIFTGIIILFFSTTYQTLKSEPSPENQPIEP